MHEYHTHTLAQFDLAVVVMDSVDAKYLYLTQQACGLPWQHTENLSGYTHTPPTPTHRMADLFLFLLLIPVPHGLRLLPPLVGKLFVRLATTGGGGGGGQYCHTHTHTHTLQHEHLIYYTAANETIEELSNK